MSPRPRVVVVWLALSLALAAIVGAPQDPRRAVLVLVGWSLIVCFTVRLHALLDAATPSAAPDAPRYRAVRLIPAAAIVGTGLAAPGALLALLVETRLGLVVGAGAIPILAVLVVPRVFARDASRFRPRATSTAGWIVVDGTLPAMLVSGPFGALVLDARLDAGFQPSVGGTARHFAVAIALYAVLLSLAAALKAAREHKAGLVIVGDEVRAPPVSASAVGALVAIAILVAWPRLGWPLAPTTLVVGKGVVGALSALCFSTLGGLRGATHVRAPPSTGAPP